MEIKQVISSYEWDKYIMNHENAGFCHLFNWKNIIMDAYHHKSNYFAAIDSSTDRDEKICGILPVYRFKRIYGKERLVSIPFFDSAGILAQDKKVENFIFQKAIEMCSLKDISALELRQAGDLTIPDHKIWTADSQIYRGKVDLYLKIIGSQQKMMKSFNSKLRNQICKGKKNGLSWKIGKQELVDQFYKVFSRNMRDLGSPVHSKKFFNSIFNYFYHNSFICIIFFKSKPVAASFMFRFKKRLSNPWASSIREYRHLQTNMFLYWQMIRFACNTGMEIFDMGRSSLGASTYRFKKQWGAEETPLFWYRWVYENSSYTNQETLSIDHWNKMPLGIANILGPMVRKNISL